MGFELDPGLPGAEICAPTWRFGGRSVVSAPCRSGYFLLRAERARRVPRLGVGDDGREGLGNAAVKGTTRASETAEEARRRYSAVRTIGCPSVGVGSQSSQASPGRDASRRGGGPAVGIGPLGAPEVERVTHGQRVGVAPPRHKRSRRPVGRGSAHLPDQLAGVPATLAADTTQRKQYMRTPATCAPPGYVTYCSLGALSAAKRLVLRRAALAGARQAPRPTVGGRVWRAAPTRWPWVACSTSQRRAGRSRPPAPPPRRDAPTRRGLARLGPDPRRDEHPDVRPPSIAHVASSARLKRASCPSTASCSPGSSRPSSPAESRNPAGPGSAGCRSVPSTGTERNNGTAPNRQVGAQIPQRSGIQTGVWNLWPRSGIHGSRSARKRAAASA